MSLPPSPILWIVGALLCLAIGIWFTFAQRVRTMYGAGAFDCWYLDRQSWRAGLMMYHPDGLRWFRRRSLRFGPENCWPRESLLMVNVRPALPEDGLPPQSDYVVAVISHNSEHLTIALPEDSCTGLASWLEAGPPGSWAQFT